MWTPPFRPSFKTLKLRHPVHLPTLYSICSGSLSIIFLHAKCLRQKCISMQLLYFRFSDIDKCQTLKPCKNGGKCTNTAGGYTCQCPVGFRGKKREESKKMLPPFIHRSTRPSICQLVGLSVRVSVCLSCRVTFN